jgi:hypothetical protein
MFNPWLEFYAWNLLFQMIYEDISKSFRIGLLERELKMVQFSTIRCSCIGILWVSLVSLAAITLCIASQRVFIVVVYFIMDSVRKLLDTPSQAYSVKVRREAAASMFQPFLPFCSAGLQSASVSWSLNSIADSLIIKDKCHTTLWVEHENTTDMSVLEKGPYNVRK